MPMKRVLLYLGVTILVVAIGVALQLSNKSSDEIVVRTISRDAASPGKPNIGGPFTLVDHTGRTVTNKDFLGKHLLVFFGYTYCPDVCPTNLTAITQALELIGKDAEKVQPLFVTVDALRDTPEQMAMYVEHFHKSLIGLTGSAEQLKRAADAYKIYSAKIKEDANDPEDYLMDHSAITYLMGPDGKYKSFFRQNLDADLIALRLKDALNAK
ncbi:MAG: SCO family protein [Proteobacteria bacterium]|nr:SCO family protein [Pseudomonadota bacterium]